MSHAVVPGAAKVQQHADALLRHIYHTRTASQSAAGTALRSTTTAHWRQHRAVAQHLTAVDTANQSHGPILMMRHHWTAQRQSAALPWSYPSASSADYSRLHTQHTENRVHHDRARNATVAAAAKRGHRLRFIRKPQLQRHKDPAAFAHTLHDARAPDTSPNSSTTRAVHTATAASAH
jgi:hypothetical protein